MQLEGKKNFFVRNVRHYKTLLGQQKLFFFIIISSELKVLQLFFFLLITVNLMNSNNKLNIIFGCFV